MPKEKRDSYVVGLHDGHGASVALMKNGCLAFALQEERLTKQKNAGGFPSQAFQFMLENQGVSVEDIDHFVLASNHRPVSAGRSAKEFTLQRYKSAQSRLRPLKRFARKTPVAKFAHERLLQKKKDVAVNYGIPLEKLSIAGHHDAHANTAYYCSHFAPEDDVLIVTADGGGDFLSCTTAKIQDGKWQDLQQIPDTDSLGRLYSSVTYWLGMLPNEHEYKVMGLAPYAHEKDYEDILEEFREILSFPSPNSCIWSRKTRKTMFEITNYLDNILKHKRFDLIAGAIQQFAEELLTELIERNLRQHGLRKVALSGGVFMNVKANKCIMESREIEDVFVMPSCGDETNAIGAAIEGSKEHGNKTDVNPLTGNFCFGPSVSNSQIEEILKRYGDNYEYQYCEDIEKEVANLIAKDEVVARVKGPMEFGARALGHRSILSNPASFKNVRIINNMVKKRDFWMPFAGSMMEEDADRYIQNPKRVEAPYMIMTFETYNETCDEIEGATHPHDRTTRPQVVSKEADPEYWRLINHFKSLTGTGCILNTSFNLHGLPIVYDAEDAMHVMENSGLEVLAIGDYLVRKQKVASE